MGRSRVFGFTRAIYSGLIPTLARLLRSCKALHIDLGMSLEELRRAVVSVVRANQVEAGYIRFSVSRGVGLGLDPANMGKAPTIVISTEQLRLYPQELYERGLDVVTASTRVPPAVCIDPQVKSLGRYINNINAKMEANRVGAGEALMLNMQGNVAEATGDNIFLIKDGELTTPPTSEGALPGINAGRPSWTWQKIQGFPADNPLQHFMMCTTRTRRS